MNNQYRFQTSAHEAAHGVIGSVVGYRVSCLEILDDDFGHCIFTRDSIRKPANFHEAEPEIIMFMSGRIAAEKAALTKWTIAKPPPNMRAEKAPTSFPTPRITLAPAHRQMTRAGEGESDSQAEQRLAASFFPQGIAGPWLYYLNTRARVMVNDHWPQILAVAGVLFWKSQVWKTEFNKLMRETKCAQ